MAAEHLQFATRLAARGVMGLTKLPPLESDVTASVSGIDVDVIVLIRPKRFAPTVPSQQEQARELSELTGMHVRPLRSTLAGLPVEAAAPVELDETDRIVLSVLNRSWQKARKVATAAGYSPSTAKVRVSLSKLKKAGLAEHRRAAGYRLAQSETCST